MPEEYIVVEGRVVEENERLRRQQKRHSDALWVYELRGEVWCEERPWREVL